MNNIYESHAPWSRVLFIIDNSSRCFKTMLKPNGIPEGINTNIYYIKILKNAFVSIQQCVCHFCIPHFHLSFRNIIIFVHFVVYAITTNTAT